MTAEELNIGDTFHIDNRLNEGEILTIKLIERNAEWDKWEVQEPQEGAEGKAVFDMPPSRFNEHYTSGVITDI